MTSATLIELQNWHRQTYCKRTKMLKAGNGKIEWIDPGTRVSWTEIVEKARDLGIDAGPVELRRALSAGKCHD